MDKNLKLQIAHLYPHEMNIYGDMGNIIAIKKRCACRNIDIEYKKVGLGKLKNKLDADIYFLGGGQDDDMDKIAIDLITNKKMQLISEINKNKVFLLICGGFQLFGQSFFSSSQKTIKGLNALPIKTASPSSAINERCIGNIITKLNKHTQKEIRKAYPACQHFNLVGFENHSGQTTFTKRATPLAKVLIGKGNNYYERLEGIRHKNVFATYLHGSLLPKNPHLTDILIWLALKNKYGEQKLKPLDDVIEWSAHKKILKNYNIL